MKELLLPSFFLSLIGFFNIFGIRQSLAINQIFNISAGFLAFFISKKIKRIFFAVNAQFFYWLLVIFLVVTFVIGLEIKGSKRWIDLYLFNFQASEIFKAFFILSLSEFLVRDYRFVNKIKIFLLSLFYFLIPAFIIFKQPDLGNAAVYLFIYLMLIIFSDLPKKYVLYFFLFLFLTLPLGWYFMKDYQRGRIISFLNPQIDQQGASYNMVQAIITVGSGQVTGRGLGLGTQSRLYFLPENHTDFAYSSLVEQFGFLGGLVVIFLYFVIALFLIKKLLLFYFLKDPRDKKNFLYLVGFLSYFIFQVLVNIGMNLGIFPITGIALPFISYGGSSLVAVMIGIALIP
ncbi:hypothetical protein A3C98_03460 [Candidatus Roizmanbacteria bacterium RIFCSPHIGHO2_02_FULL_37_15]|uniref:Rod shape-determining protein RodA n=1 Tax=Candidatus Roizmanbacteria bacterium RIFCSPLOWO2_01_FULL_37_16 TaxID=1802058 RepID=A0A1F7IIU1_9BACT|nr:MAG: hypothetical protein A2859_05265 [Candidatus Roizmanbacteria bacterium RIFCSPHIGHO2_01_FULL_37_16b]OGK20431.1 MAG: hypothetical protein A3C98_03460 [Candidatus Roizmanbacteria bacterium RIFCSPHIGHO2_02_FULL_37_15]OGK34032.1 MAG: hypothetical protein A3F57_02410 [Candidatus Roizmanbacteria bacterium RIFCSPHIGHO2_12_FULL_36_11]OGK43282.1 MAG: hypothetical protein A3B40_02205 [Candidatus Roizmanbacteria bacterium RIFCSPLOWO2_01_FULL_37_16]